MAPATRGNRRSTGICRRLGPESRPSPRTTLGPGPRSRCTSCTEPGREAALALSGLRCGARLGGHSGCLVNVAERLELVEAMLDHRRITDQRAELRSRASDERQHAHLQEVREGVLEI